MSYFTLALGSSTFRAILFDHLSVINHIMAGLFGTDKGQHFFLSAKAIFVWEYITTLASPLGSK